MELNETLKMIREFLSPANKLEQDYYNEIMTNDEEKADVFWQFGLISINLLKTLNESKFEKNANHSYISIKDDLHLNSLTQLVICFSIHYNLEDKLGVSIERLSKYGLNISKKRAEIEPHTRNQRLAKTLHILHEIKSVKQEHVNLLHQKFYPRYMHEIICSLIQLIHSPNSSLQQNDFLKKLKNWLEVDLLAEADGSNLISSLLMAQSTAHLNQHKETTWFLLPIGNLLTKLLLRENSVMNVIRAVLSEINAVSDVQLASDWKKCDLVAKIIAQCPKQTKIDEYLQFISPQLIQLFFNKDLRFARHFYRVAGSIYSLFAKRWPELTKIHVTEKLLAPLDKIDSDLSLSKIELFNKIDQIHLVFIRSTEPNWNTLSQIPFVLIKLIFQVCKEIRERINTKKMRLMCEEILRVYFGMMPADLVNANLDALLKIDLLNFVRLDLAFFDEDELNDEQCLKIDSTMLNREVTIQMVDLTCATLVALIRKFSQEKFQVDYLIYVFDEIKNSVVKMSEGKNKSDVKISEKNFFLNFEKEMNELEVAMNSRIIYFTLLTHLFESIDHQLIVDNHRRIIHVGKVIVETVLLRVRESDRDDDDDDDGETEMGGNEAEVVHLVLSIISVFTTGVIEISYEVKQELQTLNPILLGVRDEMSKFSNGNLSEMANALYETIVTFGAVKSEPKVNEVKKKPLIEELDNVNLSDYEKALKDVCDALIPVRAHGLVQLRKLIDQRDKVSLDNKEKILEIFLRNLKFDDSYVYLAAINGLISLADFNPSQVLDVLIDNYNSKKLDIENRLKIGEALTKTVRNFNALVPKYGARLLGVFLIGCKNDQEELFRSSSLSNLGETCKLLNYSLKNDIYEILNCLSSLLDTEKSVQIKRSAILVLKMIVEGLDKKNFVQILGDAIKPLYRVLSKQRMVADDEIVKLNCQLTFDYINEFMRDALMPKQRLEKEIKILHP